METASSASSHRGKSNTKKRLLRRHREEEPSRKRKRRSPSSSTTTFPLTENAVETIVRGLALTQTGSATAIRNMNVNKPANALTREEKNVLNRGDDNAKETAGQRQLVLRMRIDHAATANTTRSEGESSPALWGVLSDGTQSMNVLLLDQAGHLSRRLAKEKGRSKRRDWIIGVRGYTSTEATWNPKYQLVPLICLTSVSVLSTIKRKGSLGTPFSCNKLASVRARAGNIGSFLTEQVPFLSCEELVGASKVPLGHFLSIATDANRPAPPLTSTPASKADSSQTCAPRTLFPEAAGSNLKRVRDFVAFATAMKTLKETSASSSSGPQPSPSSTTGSTEVSMSLFSPTKLPTEHAAEIYGKTLEEFASSQMDRQNASLGTNAGRETAEKAALILQRHKDALEIAMKETKPLSVEILCQWHRELLKDIHPEAGEIRTRTVRCGQTVFCPTSLIRCELEKFCTGLLNLSERLDMNDALHVVLYAAVAMYGIVDIHPYLDGNGRLSRIVANYALKNLPFPINLFASPGQRAEYVLAVEQTRHILSMTGKGDVEGDQLLQVIKIAGAFGYLTDLLMDRVAKAALECNRVWQEKSGMAAEAAEARAARRVRERAAQGTCIICFEDRPNIATLCCGKATHLNCIAEWLSGNNTCPNCRSEMPTISGRVVRAARRSEEDERTEGRHTNEALEAAQQQILQNIRETRDLLAREYDRVAQRGRRREGSDSSDSSSFLSGLSDIGDTSSTTTSDDDRSMIALVHRSTARTGGSSVFEADFSTGASEDTTTAAFPEGDNEMHDTTVAEGLDETTEVENDETRDSGQENYGGIRGRRIADAGENEENNGNDANASGETRRSRQRLTYCAGDLCRNRAAVDCTNHLCGRCCILAGEFHCSRHNS